MNTQEFTSKNTSVNKAKLPAIYNKLNWEIIKETDKIYFVNDWVIDYGCGKYVDHIKSFLINKGFYFMGYDLYNQPMDKNQETIETLESSTPIGVIICSNLLCVIKEDEIVQQIVNQVTATRQPYFFTVYEGDKSGVGKQTGEDQWQRNQKLKSIYSQFFANVPDAIVYKGTICNKDYKNYLKKTKENKDMKYETNYYFYEENINGNFDNVEPHHYSIWTKKYPTPQNDLDILFECLEVERIGCKHVMVEKQVVNMHTKEYIDSDEAVVTIDYLAYTQELSPFINWDKTNMPPIYKIDREKSKITINDN